MIQMFQVQIHRVEATLSFIESYLSNYLDPNTLPRPLVKAFPTKPVAPLPKDPKAERVAIPVAHLFLASLSH